MVVLEMLAVAAIFSLSFALLFRDKPIEFKFTIRHEHEEPVSRLEEMRKELDKDEKEIFEKTDSLLGYVNKLMTEGLDSEPFKEEDKK